MQKVTVRHLDHGVELVAADRWVRADTSGHSIKLTSHNGLALELGALRSAYVTAMGVVLEELALPPHRHDLTPVGNYLEQALARSASSTRMRDLSLEAAIAEIYPTPLVYARPFLDARYLWQDAFRFRACRVAIAHAEDDWIDEDSAATAAAVIAALGKWRELYAAKGTSKKALNVALHDFGDTLPAAALWGLRRVVLTRPRPRPTHLELLGWLGALPTAAGLGELIAVVERAPDDELEQVLGAGERTPRALALHLANADAGSSTLLQVVRSAEAKAQ